MSVTTQKDKINDHSFKRALSFAVYGVRIMLVIILLLFLPKFTFETLALVIYFGLIGRGSFEHLGKVVGQFLEKLRQKCSLNWLTPSIFSVFISILQIVIVETIPTLMIAVIFLYDLIMICYEIKENIPQYYANLCLFYMALVKRDRIYDREFMNCKMSNVTIPDGIKKVGQSAFNGSSKLREIDLPNVIEVGLCAFANCSALEKVRMKNVKLIEQQAFEDCDNLSSVEMRSVKKIGDWAFKNCKNLKELKLESCDEIGHWAFKNCKNLEELNLENCREIGYHAFEGCVNLKKLDISKSKIEFFFDALIEEGSAQVESIIISCNSQYDLTGFRKLNFIGIKPDTNGKISNNISNNISINFPTQRSINIKIYDGVECIPAFWLYGMTNLNSIEIADSVGPIGMQAFYGCSRLKKVKMSKNTKTIGPMAFKNCESLESIEFADTVEKIYRRAFENCRSLKKVIIHNGLGIMNNVFSGCDGLEMIVLADELITARGEYSRYGIEDSQKVLSFSKFLQDFRKENKLEDYKNDELYFLYKWKNNDDFYMPLQEIVKKFPNAQLEFFTDIKKLSTKKALSQPEWLPEKMCEKIYIKRERNHHENSLLGANLTMLSFFSAKDAAMFDQCAKEITFCPKSLG